MGTSINTPDTRGLKFYSINNSEQVVTLRFQNSHVRAGFPSPALDYMEEEIDFNKLLAPKPQSTFLVKVDGDSMIEAFIPPGSYLVVDRSVKPSNNMIVIAVVNGEFTVKRFIKNSSGVRLMPANPKYQPIPITEDIEFSVWGTVTNIIINTSKCS